MKHLNRIVWLSFSVAPPFVFAAVLFPGLPEKVPVHFGADGRPDAWGGRGSIFLGPGITGVASVFIYALLTNIGRIDPKHRTSGEETAIKDFPMFLTAFLSLLSLCMIAATAWPGLPMIRLMIGTLGIGFFGMGRYMPRLDPNYFAGFRLPWTLEDPVNWASTHRLAGRIWTWGATCIFLSALLLDGSWLWAVFTISLSVMGFVLFACRLYIHGLIQVSGLSNIVLLFRSLLRFARCLNSRAICMSSLIQGCLHVGSGKQYVFHFGSFQSHTPSDVVGLGFSMPLA